MSPKKNTHHAQLVAAKEMVDDLRRLVAETEFDMVENNGNVLIHLRIQPGLILADAAVMKGEGVVGSVRAL